MATAPNNRVAVATVRIAPVEQWCEGSLKSLAKNPRIAESVGAPVVIFTQQMRQSNSCDGREWVAGNGRELERDYRELIYPEHKIVWVCEHLLEMD